MNRVGTWGGTKKQRELTYDVVMHCIDVMMPRLRTLEICVDLMKLDECDGYCLARDNREFEIQIDKSLKGDDFISAICHEMVHVKQHARGELKDTDKLVLKKWKGEEFIAMYSTVDEYMALPWEAEAYELQEVLTKSFNDLKKQQKRISKK